MRIFNLNTSAIILGPVLGRSAGVPSRFNLFWECFKIYKWKVLSKKYKINLTKCRKPVNKSMHRHPNLTCINFPCAGLINHCTGPLIWPALISRVPVNKSMNRPPNLTGINFPCAGLINHCTGPLIWLALISCVPVNKSMNRPPNLTGINFPCAGINCRCNV